MKALARQLRRHWDDILAYFRPPAHQRGPQGPEQHHPERQDPREGLQEHGLFQHDDLPDLRQTRPANRRHLTRFTHTKQRKARNT